MAKSFSSFTKPDELVAYLTSSTRLNNVKYVAHYTKVSALKGMLKSKIWILNNPNTMNDKLELSKYPKEAWENVFYACFMTEQSESIPMWSMYAQPWEDGLQLSISNKDFLQWASEIKTVFEIDPNTKELTGRSITDPQTVHITKVAYTNYDSGRTDEPVSITCGTVTNTHFTRPYSNEEFIGYIKDDAWKNEQEIRLRVDLPPDLDYKLVGIQIPDYIIANMIITKGPRFFGNLLERIDAKGKKIHFRDSCFQGKLGWVYCDTCKANLNPIGPTAKQYIDFQYAMTHMLRDYIKKISDITKTDYNQIILRARKDAYNSALIVVASRIAITKQDYRYVIGSGIISKAILSGTLQNIGDVSKCSDYFQAVHETESELVVPIIKDKMILGGINSEAPIKNHYSHEMVSKLQKLSDELADLLVYFGYKQDIAETSLPYEIT